MQLIWTPKLINICGEDTRELFRPARRPFFEKPSQRSMQRPFLLISLAWPFCYLPQVNNKAVKGLCIICTQRWKQTCCFACHFPTFHLPLATCRRVELSWAEPKSSFHIKFTFFGAMIYCHWALQTEKPRENKLKKWKEKGKRIFPRPEMKFKAS